MTVFVATVTPLMCECGKFDLARPGHTLHRIHVNNFIEREDEAETHSRKKCWPPKTEPEALTDRCKCLGYNIGTSNHYVLQIEWGRWAENSATGHHRYTYAQETHKHDLCAVYRNGERIYSREPGEGNVRGDL